VALSSSKRFVLVFAVRVSEKDGEDPGTTRDDSVLNCIKDTTPRDRLRARNSKHRCDSVAAHPRSICPRALDALVRAGLHYFDDESEVERFDRAMVGKTQHEEKLPLWARTRVHRQSLRSSALRPVATVLLCAA
jgi:hypothetical protein